MGKDTDLIALGKLAHSLRKEGRYKEAEESYNLVLKKDPTNIYALAGLGDIHKALDAWLHYLTLNSDDYKIMTRVADGLRKKRDLGESKRYYVMALKIASDDPYALHGKADCYRGLKRYSSAIEVWQLALKRGIYPRMALTRIGDAYLSLEDLPNAEASYGKALDFGHDKYAYLGLARIHAKGNHRDRALQMVSMIVEKWPGDSRVASEIKRFVREYPLRLSNPDRKQEKPRYV